MPVEVVPEVTADAEVAFGKPVIDGTRIPEAQVLPQLSGGERHRSNLALRRHGYNLVAVRELCGN